MMATDYTDGIALRALQMIFTYLPRAYDNGPSDPEAREKMANAATMAGMAFANAFLGSVPLHGPQAGCLPPPAPRWPTP